MSATETPLTGGCLCGQLRYTLRGAPAYAGYCYCADCRKASGSGFIPFMGVAADRIAVSGEARQARASSFRGTEAVRNFCPACGGLVFGGVLGVDTEHTVYAGTLDQPESFRPTLAIFARDRPAWVPLPPDLVVFDTMPD